MSSQRFKSNESGGSSSGKSSKLADNLTFINKLPSNAGSRIAPVSMDKNIAEQLEKGLINELFSHVKVKHENFLATKSFVNQPIRKEEIVSTNDDRLLARLEKEVVKDIEIMKKRISSGEITNKDDDRPIEVLDPRFFHPNSKLPQSVRKLLLYMHWKLRIPADCHCKIKICAGKRRARTNCQPIKRKNDRVCRIITHFGQDDVYKLTDNILGNSKEYTMVNGASILLNRNQLNTQALNISNLTKITFPSNIPDDVDIEAIAKAQISKMKTPGRGGKMSIDTSRIKGMTQRTSIRLRRYIRISVIMDFGPSVYIAENKVLDIARSINKTAAPNGLTGGIPTELPEHIRAQLPKNIRGIVENSGGKLNQKVSEIGRNIVSDLGDRPELNSPQPTISESFISDVASSAIRNININDIKDLEPDINKLTEAVGIDNLPIDPEVRRRMKREKRKARGTRHNFTNDPIKPSINSNSSSSSSSNNSILSDSVNIESNIGDLDICLDNNNTNDKSGNILNSSNTQNVKSKTQSDKLKTIDVPFDISLDDL